MRIHLQPRSKVEALLIAAACKCYQILLCSVDNRAVGEGKAALRASMMDGHLDKEAWQRSR